MSADAATPSEVTAPPNPTTAMMYWHERAMAAERDLTAAREQIAALAFAAGARSGEDARDAARYRRIKRDHEIPWGQPVPLSRAGRFYVMFGEDAVGCIEGELDAAIDAAMGGNDA